MKLKTLESMDLRGKTVLCRVAYDIAPKKKDGALVVDDLARIRATIPTIEYLIAQQCRIVLLTWVKRPGGVVDESLRTAPHAAALAAVLGRPVAIVQDCIGPEVDRAVAAMKPGELLMLENVRFHPEEEANDPEFAEALVKGMDVIVFDAFAQAHRECASTTGILALRTSVVGRCMEAEMTAFGSILHDPKRPLVAILAGAKISDKIDMLRFLLDRADLVLIGGALANTFLAALGKPVEASLVESSVVDAEQKTLDILEVAADLVRNAPAVSSVVGWPPEVQSKIVLPIDRVAGSAVAPDAEHVVVDFRDAYARLPAGWTYLDIGPATIALYRDIIARAGTIFWNGPLGYSEIAHFEAGTREIAEAITASGAFSIVGGGDTETIVERYGLEGKFGHVSTGGGVSVELLAGKELPVVKYLYEQK